MTQKPPLTSTEVIAERVRQLMQRKGWTAQQLVDELAKVGIEWTRLIVANLLVKKSDRRRRYVTVDELLALSYVLDVAPIHLLLPLDDYRAMYAYAPSKAAPTYEVRNWVRGRIPIDDQDNRVFFSEVPDMEFTIRRGQDESVNPVYDSWPGGSYPDRFMIERQQGTDGGADG